MMASDVSPIMGHGFQCETEARGTSRMSKPCLNAYLVQCVAEGDSARRAAPPTMASPPRQRPCPCRKASPRVIMDHCTPALRRWWQWGTEGLAGRGAVRENKVFEKCTWGKGA
jgi:hypothetical protein